MKIRRLAGLAILMLVFIISCAGNYGIYKRKTGGEAKAAKQELIANWSDYDISLLYHNGYKPPRLIAIIFDTKIDGKKIND